MAINSTACVTKDYCVLFLTMSLPRGNYDPRRVCINPFPELTLGKHKRTIGVYLAGALVRPSQFKSNKKADILTRSPTFLVRTSQLDIPRRRCPLRTCHYAMGRPSPSPHHLHRLAPRTIIPHWHAHRQPNRQGPNSWERRI
jgi:hypothetical protein